jgi:Tfp pilus assembly protein PilO
VFALIGGMLGVVYWKLAYLSLDERLEAAQAEHRAKLATHKRLADDLANYDNLRAHMTKLREQFERNQAVLPSEPEIPAFFETLQRKASESGVEIRKWTDRNPEPVESFVRMPFEIEIGGTFMQIKRFFASLVQNDIKDINDINDIKDIKDIKSVRPTPPSPAPANEARERIVSIENLSLGSPTVKNREIILAARFTAVVFRQGDKPVAQDLPASGSTAGTAKASPSRSATPGATTKAASSPPLPSAASPAGAKAEVEQTLDKGNAPNRGAAGADEAKLPATGSDRLKGGP